MALVKSDPRYQANRKFVFASTILTEAEVLADGAIEPGTEPPTASDVHADVRRLQKLLGFSEAEQDGIFGAITAEAVRRFQRRHGLPVTGDADKATWEALEREAAGAPVNQPAGPAVTPPASGTPDLVPETGTMNPLIAIAARILPEIARTVVSDKAGTIAAAVIKAVTDITRTDNPKEAAEKLNADPAAADALRFKLAEIAAAQEEKRLQMQIALLKEQNEQEAIRREAQLEELRVGIEDTKNARSTFSALALANNPMAWGAPLVSLLVTIGFFGILTILILGWGDLKENSQVAQIINITVGALAAAFATVVSFWLGSSQGSRAKDAATIQLQAEQVNQSVAQTEALKSTVQAQAKQAEALHASMRSAMAGTPAAAAAKPSNFRRCLDIVLGYEGGFSQDTGDPGGATQFGLTIPVLRDFRQDATLGVDDLKKLGRDEACEIYRTRYWNVLRCDDLPTGVDLVVFDFAADTNAGRAAKMLQQVVGAEADGSVGDATLAATRAMRATDVVKDISNRRSEYYRALPDAANLMRAAIARANAVEKTALDMIAAAERPAAQ
jgi:lysozyme family protein